MAVTSWAYRKTTPKLSLAIRCHSTLVHDRDQMGAVFGVRVDIGVEARGRHALALEARRGDDILSKLAVILSNSKLIMEYRNYQLEPFDFTDKRS